MRKFTCADDLPDVDAAVRQALELKKNPYGEKYLGENKTVGLIFFNSSLRTRLSSQRAAQNLGANVIVMNVGTDGWALEFEDGVVMEGTTAEHIKEAAPVMAQYCDILGIRSFPGLKDREFDYSERILSSFIEYTDVPIVSLESATSHPLQALADLITIEEFKKTPRPKVVLTWAGHPRALPQSVPNAFADFMTSSRNVDFVIACPPGYELCEKFTRGAPVEHDQEKALAGADFVYAKNWSSYTHYGQILKKDYDWMIDERKMALTNHGKFMHCLPVRRNVIVSEGVLDSPASIVVQEAKNREVSAQYILREMLKGLR